MNLVVAQVDDTGRSRATIAAARFEGLSQGIPGERHLRLRVASQELHVQPIRGSGAADDGKRPEADPHRIPLDDVRHACSIDVGGRGESMHLAGTRLGSRRALNLAPNFLMDAVEVLAKPAQVSRSAPFETSEEVLQPVPDYAVRCAAGQGRGCLQSRTEIRHETRVARLRGVQH